MIIENPDQRGKYVVTFDPLDGSSNIDCGVSIGTIFGIFKVVNIIQVRRANQNVPTQCMQKDEGNPNISDCIRSGRELIAAGYCMYGSYCEMILVSCYSNMACFMLLISHALQSVGNGVNGFTLDPSIGEFIMTHPKVRKINIFLVMEASYFSGCFGLKKII